MAIRSGWLRLDLRALALFRVSLALLALCDLFFSARDLRAFYSDQGILPRSALDLPWASHCFVVFLGSGEAGWQMVWLGLAAVCAGLLLVGKHSRWALFWLWYLLASLHIRDSLSADRGAMMLEILCFWGFFLPLEARFSLAARQNPHWARLPNCYRSLGCVALLLQFACIYLFTAALKNGRAWVVDFNAVEVACRSAQVSTAYSEWLAHFPGLLKLATWATLVGEGLMPLFLLSPIAHDRLRTGAVALLVVFHLHNCFVFRLGFFPFMNALCSLVLLPTPFWDRLWGSGPPPDPEPVSPETLPAAYRLPYLVELWLGICLAYCCYCNLQTSPKPRKAHLLEPMRSFGKLFRLEQYWNLFSPSPPNDLWFRLLARDRNGHEVNLWRRDRQVTLEREVSPMASVPSHLWQMVLLNSVYKEDQNLSRSIVNYWERQYEGEYQDFRYQVVIRDFDQDGRAQTARVRTLWPPQPAGPRVVLP